MEFFLLFCEKSSKSLDILYKIHKMKEVREKNIANITKCKNGTNEKWQLKSECGKKKQWM